MLNININFLILELKTKNIFRRHLKKLKWKKDLMSFLSNITSFTKVWVIKNYNLIQVWLRIMMMREIFGVKLFMSKEIILININFKEILMKKMGLNYIISLFWSLFLLIKQRKLYRVLLGIGKYKCQCQLKSIAMKKLKMIIK